MLNLYDIEPCSEIYGPGKRMVFWLQGCSIRCKGCWNRNMWSFDENKIFTNEMLFALIQENEDIEGVTFLGGEPLDQANELLKLIKQIAETDLSIFLSTGYEQDAIKDPIKIELLSLCDIIVYGKYDETQRNLFLQWRGSNNQRVVFNTSRYADYQMQDANYCEVHIAESGEVEIMGYPMHDLVETLKKSK